MIASPETQLTGESTSAHQGWRQRAQLAIRGILADGNWISEPSLVKNEFFHHFSKQFSSPPSSYICLDYEFPVRLTSDKVEDLENNGKRNEGFVDDPNGDQFPPISAQDRFDDLGEIHDCLDQDIGDKRNRNVEYEKFANRSDDSASKYVYQDKVDKIVEKESDANMGRALGVFGV
ncbi:hypothetical protein Tco_1148690 [Tanacetum coccineum]